MNRKEPASNDASGSEDHQDGDASGRATPERRPPTSALLERIAATLQVPTAVLFDAPSDPKDGSDHEELGMPAESLDRQSVELIHAFRRIEDPHERGRLLALVQDAAERA